MDGREDGRLQSGWDDRTRTGERKVTKNDVAFVRDESEVEA